MKKSTRNLLMLHAALVPALFATQVFAQQAAPASAAAAGPNSDVLDDVVVTAQRRTQLLQQTPVAVTAVSGEALEQRNVSSSQDLMRLVPSLQASTSSSGLGTSAMTFFLRGMGQQRSANGTSPAVGVYVDDLYYPSLNGQNFSIIDVEQVEVLRGPQGTLFGRSTLGGAIRYTTKGPDFNGINGHIIGTYGTDNRHDLAGAVNLPIADNAAFRLTAGTLNQDGYVKRADGGRDAGGFANDLVRGQFRWAPTENLDVDLSALFSQSKSFGSPFAIRSIDTTARTAASWNAANAANPSRLLNSQWISKCDYCQPGTDVEIAANTEYSNGAAAIAWHPTDSLTIKSLTGYQKVDNVFSGDTDGTPLPIQNVPRILDNVEVWSQEFQFSGTVFNDRLDWVGGLYYFDQDSYLQQTTLQFNANIPANKYTTNVTTEAAFLDGTLRLDDRLKLLGGIRYSEDQIDVELHSPADVLLNSGSKKFPSTTGRLGIQMQWTPDIMSYASASRGFRAGGYVQDNGFLTSFEPETATSYEAGIRADLFGGKLRVNPTVFYTEWEDIQVQYQLQAGAVRYFVIENAGKAHSYGLELESEAAVTDSLRLFGNLALLEMEYDSIGAAQGITLDSKFQRAPKVTYTVGVRYRKELANGFGVRSSVDWNWQDEQNSSPGDADTLNLPSYGLLGARVDLQDPDRKWTLSMFGTNLLNETYYVGGINYRSTVGTSKWDLGRPRQVAISLRRSF